MTERPTDEENGEQLRQASEQLRQATERLRAVNDQRRLSATYLPPKRPDLRLIQGGRKEE